MRIIVYKPIAIDTQQYYYIFITYPLTVESCEGQLGLYMPCRPENYGLYFRLIYSLDL